MADQVKLQVLHMTPSMKKRGKKQHGQRGKVVANLSKLLSRKSHEADRKKIEKPAKLHEAGKHLVSDLVIQSPAYGTFTTVLRLKTVLCRDNIEQVVVKVYGTKVQILFTKQSQDGKKTKNDCKDQGNPGLCKNVIQKLRLFGKNTEKQNEKECHKIPDDDDLTVHGYICLPDYICSQSLDFSFNSFGDLKIIANMKGVSHTGTSSVFSF